MYVLFFCLLDHLLSSDFSFYSFFLLCCRWVSKRVFKCSQTFRSSKEKEIWERAVKQMCHRGSQGEIRPGSGTGWCCEVGTLVGSLVGSLRLATLHSQLLCWFYHGLGSAGCNLGGRDGIINKEREKVEILPKPALKQQFPRAPDFVMDWEGEL